MGHDHQVGQASDQATEVGRAGAGLPPQRTDPKQGTLTEPSNSRVTPRKQTRTNPASQPQASHNEQSQALQGATRPVKPGPNQTVKLTLAWQTVVARSRSKTGHDIAELP